MCVYVLGHARASVGEVVSSVCSLCSLVLTRDACSAVTLWDCVVVGVGMALRWRGIGADVREGGVDAREPASNGSIVRNGKFKRSFCTVHTETENVHDICVLYRFDMTRTPSQHKG